MATFYNPETGKYEKGDKKRRSAVPILQVEMPDDMHSLLSGDAPPSNEAGEDGDFYIDTKEWKIYGPKAESWAEGTNLIGKEGEAGKDGKDGLNGVNGIDGKNGADGKDGVDGLDGVNGRDGVGLVYSWDGTKLGVRRENEDEFQYVDLKGEAGLSLGGGGRTRFKDFAQWLVAGTNTTLDVDYQAKTITIASSGGGGGVSDGDKGDITVSGTGATWTIDNDVVTTTKLGGDITAAGKALLDDADAAAQRTTLGVGAVGQLATIVANIGVVFDGNGSAVASNSKVYLQVPFAMTITGWTILADQSGSCVVDVWKDTYANYPPTVADTIAGSEKPTLSTAQKNQDLTLSTWTTSVSAGDTLVFNVDSATTVQKVTVVLLGTRAT